MRQIRAFEMYDNVNMSENTMLLHTFMILIISNWSDCSMYVILRNRLNKFVLKIKIQFLFILIIFSK